MKLHLNQGLFQDAILATSQAINIPEIYIEKDYWVTLALHEIFHSPMASEAVFKGGTALLNVISLFNGFLKTLILLFCGMQGKTTIS